MAMRSILAQDTSHKTGHSRVTWKDGQEPRQEKKGAAVLTAESLQNLAKEVSNKKLVVAMLLNIPTTQLVNMGADQKFCQTPEIEQMLVMLQHWKKMRDTAKEKEKVSDLERGLRAAGFVDIADIIAERHKDNLELTADCFQQL